MKEKGPRAFLDTNVWISAYVFTGNEKEIVRKAINGEFSPIISDQVIGEFIRIIRDKFGFPKRSVFDAVSEMIQISEISEIAEIHDTKDIGLRDKDDTAIVNAALVSKCEFLVTGDKSIIELKRIGDTKIIKPGEFLAILKRNGSVKEDQF